MGETLTIFSIGFAVGALVFGWLGYRVAKWWYRDTLVDEE